MNKTTSITAKKIGFGNKILGVAAAMAMLLACTTTAHAARTSVRVSPSSISFGTVAVGSTSAAHSVTVTNESRRSMTIESASDSAAQFSFSGTSFPVTLSGGQSLTGSVTFRPSAGQAYSGTLQFMRSNGSTFSIALSGTGSSTSSAVAPTISSQPASAKITTGQTATFNVAATGTAPMAYQWSKNGSPLSGATSSSYTTPAETMADNSAKFTVAVSNSAGSATSNAAVLTVSSATVAPAITTQPASQTILSGNTATFSVAATGTGPLTYQWSKGGVVISGATAASYTTPAETTGAQFSVTVSNSAGSVTSNAATLTVTAATLILNSSTSSVSFGSVTIPNTGTQTVTLTNAGNSAVTISNVSVSGSGFNATGASGVILQPGQTTTVTPTFKPAAAGAVTGKLTVTSNATNSPDSISLSGTGVAAVSHSVALSWSPSTSSGVTGYNTYSSQVSGGPYTKLTSAPVTGTSYTDSAVQAGQTYYFVVTSLDSSNVESAFSAEVSAVIP
ncbi:MAG TPA: choice-of-anchor D domain-containing protein [Candidatus Acidoferrales bacterium]|nr:choice-of-anchor D domain-containing protein [Candidatus Acidoferrales bacterium]